MKLLPIVLLFFCFTTLAQPTTRPRIPVYEMTPTPVCGFGAVAWQFGWVGENCSESPQPTNEQKVRRFARMVNTGSAGLTFWNSQGVAVADQLKGKRLAILDQEVLGSDLLDACKIFRRQCPNTQLTCYGFAWSTAGYDPAQLLDGRTQAFRDHLATLKGSADRVTMIDVSCYLGRDNSMPVDDDRDCTRNLFIFYRMVEEFRRAYPGKPLCAIIWPRLMYSADWNEPVPDKWVPLYVEIAARCDAIVVFDLRPVDKLFIKCLREGQRAQVRGAMGSAGSGLPQFVQLKPMNQQPYRSEFSVLEINFNPAAGNGRILAKSP